MKKLLAVGLTALCAAGLTGRAEPVDGFYWAVAWYHHLSTWTGQLRYWENNNVPADGGVAYFLGTAAGNAVFGSPVTLRGFDYRNVQAAMSGGVTYPVMTTSGNGSLTLMGEAFITGLQETTVPNLSLAISGTGANTFAKRGPANLPLGYNLRNFGTVAMEGGSLVTKATSGQLFADGNPTFAIHGGAFDWQPATAAGSSASATMGATTYGQGGAIKWNKGAGDAATLTLASLTRDRAGGTLLIQPANGLAALGSTELLKITAAPTLVNGILDPSIVAQDPSKESYPLCFLTYDAEKGVVPFPEANRVALEDATATDIAVVSVTNTFSTSKRVAALVVDNSSELTLDMGVTLSVGDDNADHPAGVIFNRQIHTGNNKAVRFAGAGTLDFGASPGVIWSASPRMDGWGANRAIQVRTKITGRNGVTFAARERGTTSSSVPYFDLTAGYCQWTGPTYVSGAMLWLQGANALPAGDVHVESSLGFDGTQFRVGSPDWTFPQNFFFAAGGTHEDGWAGVYQCFNSGTTTFTGPVTLTGDTSFCGNGGVANSLVFKNEVRGPGKMILKTGCTVGFYKPCTIGDFETLKASVVNVREDGTLGTGRIWLDEGASSFNFINLTRPQVITNKFRMSSGSLKLGVTRSDVTLNTDVVCASTVVDNYSQFRVGGKVDAGALTVSGGTDANPGPMKIVAYAAGAVLGFGNDNGNGSIGVPLADGTGTLGIDKKGSGTYDLGLVEHTYTGPTTVSAGTLRLADDPRFSQALNYWFDASREEDFEKDAETGVITKWNARAASKAVSFAADKGTPKWGKASKVNGHDVVTTTKDGTADHLKATAKFNNRTIILVYRLKSVVNMGGIIGGTDIYADYGMRINGSAATSPWDVNRSHYNYNTTGWVRRDGAKNGAVDVGVPHILTLVHDKDNWEPSVTWGAATYGCEFTPELGYYQSATRNFDGDYCEILSFNRVLTESEMRVVENYLSEKWLNKTIWSDLAKPTMLPATTALTVNEGATFDLNGNSVTVASLAGNGTITNSSATAATLTVTGGGSFTGKVGGKTTVSSGGNMAFGAAFGAEAGVAATGGTLTTGTHLLTPPTDGLAYWCDAGLRETILTNESGAVTGWVSRATSSASALINDGVTKTGSSTFTRPVYSGDGLAGKPAVRFDNLNSLWANVKSPVRTVFLVVSSGGTQVNCRGFWGIQNLDIGFRMSQTAGAVEGWGGGVRWCGKYDWFTVNGAKTDGFNLSTASASVIASRLDADKHTEAFYRDYLGLGTSSQSRTTALGAYVGNACFNGYIGEAIAYDRALSDDEMVKVQDYLIAKWRTASWTEGHPPAESEPSFGTAASVSVAGGATVDLGGTDLTVGTLGSGAVAGGGTIANVGTLTVTDGFVIDVVDGTAVPIRVNGNLTIGPSATATVNDWQNLSNAVRVQDAILATGAIVGDVGCTMGRSWRWTRYADGWKIVKGGLFMIVR